MNLTRDEIIEAVNSALINEMELDPASLAPEKTFFDDLGLDSLDMVDLMIGLQRKFGVSLRDNEEIKTVRTLGDVYDFFEKNQAMLTAQAEAAKRNAQQAREQTQNPPEN